VDLRLGKDGRFPGTKMLPKVCEIREELIASSFGCMLFFANAKFVF
jgi:hypothetical protein